MDLGEWGTNEAPTVPDAAPAVSPAGSDPLAIPHGLVEQTVRAAVASTVRKAASAAVAASFSEEQLAALRDRARQAAEREFAVLDDPAADADPPALLYPNVAEFVTDFLVPLYVRATTTWCPEWYRHAEGIYRLEALWRAWERLRLDPALGASVWLLQHADPHMRVLLDADGPFRGCTSKGGHIGRVKPLPLVPPPADAF